MESENDLQVTLTENAGISVPRVLMAERAKAAVRRLYPAAFAMPVSVLASLPVRVAGWQVFDAASKGASLIGAAIGPVMQTEEAAWIAARP